MPVPRSTLVFSALLAAGTTAFTVYLFTHANSSRPVAPNSCNIRSSHSLSSDPAERALSLLDTPQGPISLLVTRRHGHTLVRCVRLSPRTAPQTLITAEADSPAAVSSLLSTPDGPTFATWRSGTLTATVLSQPSPHRITFPRLPPSPERPTATPSVSLSLTSDNTLQALLVWPEPYGLRRVTSRTTLESSNLFPLSNTTQLSPSLTLSRDRLWVSLLEETTPLTPSPTAPPLTTLVFVSHPAAPFDPSPPVTLRLPLTSTANNLSLTTLPSGDLLAHWTEPTGPHYLRFSPTVTTPTSLPTPISFPGDAQPWTLAVHPHCGPIAAWFRNNSLQISPLPSPSSPLSHPLVLTNITPAPVFLSASSDRLTLATVQHSTVSLHNILLSVDCTPTAQPLPLPPPVLRAFTPASPPRIVSLQSDNTRTVLAVTSAPPTATTTTVHFVTVTARQTTVFPPAATVSQSVGAMALLTPPTVVLSGSARGTLRLQRIDSNPDPDDPDDNDNTPGEDLLLHDGHGPGDVLLASPELHRVWVAYTASPTTRDTFHQPRAVIVQSAIDALEDGPRIDVTAAPRPHLQFSTITATTARPAQNSPHGDTTALTFSASTPLPGQPCLPGAFALTYDNSFANHTSLISLVSSDLADCTDRVRASLSLSQYLTAIITGPRLGTRIVSTNLSQPGTLTSTPLDTVSPRVIAAPTLIPWAGDTLAFWLDTTQEDPSLRVRRFSPDARPRGGAITLGQAIGSTFRDVTLPAAPGLDPTTAFAVVPTAHGPRLVNLHCAR